MRTRAIALAAATGVALSGCSMIGAEDAGGDSTTATSESSQSAEGSQDAAEEEPSENGAAQAGFDAENPPEPIGQLKLTNVDDVVESTTIDLLQLRRDENVMLATFRLTGEGRGAEGTTAFSLLGDESFRPVFIDLENMEKYNSIADLTSNYARATAPLGEPVYLFTAFPLPREGVTEMDLQVVSTAQVIEDVPMPE